MELTIIIVSWNVIDMLRDCLRSVRDGMNTAKMEVIVVDNFSSDGSQQMVSTQFPSVTLIRNTENRGFAAANNQALRISKGKYVLLLNSDTVVLGDVLQRSVDYMEAHNNVGVMGCRVLNTDGSLQLTCSQFPTLLNLILLASGLWKLTWPKFFDRYHMKNWDRTDQRDVDVVSGCYMMLRADAIRQVGILDEDFFFFGEETDWCKRLKDAGWRIRFAPVGEIIHHGGGSVRRFDYKRDLMLSSAIVKLHLKHGGLAPGVSAWIILFGFNLSRALFWMIISLMKRGEGIRNRRDHFLSLVRNYHRVWPSGRTLIP